MTKVKHTVDGCVFQAILDADGNVSIQAVSGFRQGVDILLTLENNGNGYYVKHNSYNCTIPDHLFNLDYSELEYLWLACEVIMKEQKKKEKSKNARLD